MKYLIIIISLVIISFKPLRAQNPSAQQIVNRYVEVTGGDNWKKIKSSKFILKVEMEDPLYVFEYLIIKGSQGKYYYQTTIGDSTWTEVYNSGRGIRKHAGKVEIIDDKEELEEMYLQSHILPDMEYEKLGYKLTLIGSHKFENFDCYEIEITSPVGKVKTNFYDKNTGYLIMINDSETNTIFTDYTAHEACLYPDKILVKLPDGRIMSILNKETIVNPKIDDTYFKF